MAILFENALKIPAHFWMEKQYRFNEYKTRHFTAFFLLT